MPLDTVCDDLPGVSSLVQGHRDGSTHRAVILNDRVIVDDAGLVLCHILKMLSLAVVKASV